MKGNHAALRTFDFACSVLGIKHAHKQWTASSSSRMRFQHSYIILRQLERSTFRPEINVNPISQLAHKRLNRECQINKIPILSWSLFPSESLSNRTSTFFHMASDIYAFFSECGNHDICGWIIAIFCVCIVWNDRSAIDAMIWIQGLHPASQKVKQIGRRNQYINLDGGFFHYKRILVNLHWKVFS